MPRPGSEISSPVRDSGRLETLKIKKFKKEMRRTRICSKRGKEKGKQLCTKIEGLSEFCLSFQQPELKLVCLHFAGFLHAVSSAQFPCSVSPGFFAWEGQFPAGLASWRALPTGGGRKAGGAAWWWGKPRGVRAGPGEALPDRVPEGSRAGRRRGASGLLTVPDNWGQSDLITVIHDQDDLLSQDQKERAPSEHASAAALCAVAVSGAGAGDNVPSCCFGIAPCRRSGARRRRAVSC